MPDVPEKRSQSQLWGVLDQLRYELPTHEVVVMLAALIYLRWVDFQEAEQEAIAAFDDTIYKSVLPSSLHWRSWHLLPPHELQTLFSNRLPEILEQLNNSRHISLATHLHRIASAVRRLGKLSPHALDFLIHWLADQPFETPLDRRELLASFDAVLDKSRDKHAAAYRTPGVIVRLLVSLAGPSIGDRVYDPCFGSAGLLTAAFDYARSKATQQFSRSGSPALSVSGVEINPDAYIIGLVRLTLAGVDDPQIELGNSLERTPSNNPERDGFDIVLANPPWGWRANSLKEDRWGLQHYSFPTNEGSGLFVQHALQQLRPNGLAVMLVPDGLLFRGGSDQQLRRYFLENHTVESIVSLPSKAFMPYSSVKASILIVRRGGTTKRIRMIDTTSLLEKCIGENPVLQQEMLTELTDWVQSTTPGDHFWDIDMETLPEIDWDLTPKRRNRSGLKRILDELRTKVTFVSLKECCEISSGQSFPRDQLLTSPPFRERVPEQKSLFSDSVHLRQKFLFETSVIPYVRIKDVQRGQASGGSSWLSPNVAASADARWKLKVGDILLSKSGTVGKTGLVRNGAVGAIAAAGLFVLRPYQDRLDPHFLLAYLSSRDIKAWLDDRTRGATVRHLSISSLGELPVAVPPLQVQQRVALEHREHGVDALTFLAWLLTQSEQDTTAAWIEKAGTALLSENEAVEDPLNLAPLDRFAAHVREERSRAMHENHGAEDLEPWMLAFHEAIFGLHEVSRIPLGPGLLSVLQESAKGLDRAMGLITRILPYHDMARDFVKRVADHIGLVCSTLLATVKLVVSAETVSFPAGEVIESAVEIDNQGPLPLRNLAVETHPDWGRGTISYLAENSRTRIVLSGAAPKKLGSFTITVAWAAETLDGKSVEGTRELVLNIVDKASESTWIAGDIGASPYVCGDPVRPDRNDVFFGREELLEQIRRQVLRSGNVVLLEGNRRSGKSSVLFHLEGTNAIPGWLGVYCNLQGAEGSREGVGVPTAEVFREMAKSIAKGLQALGGDTPLPDGTVLPPARKLGIAKACREGIGETSPFSDFRDYVEVTLDILAKRNFSMLLMLDEFDKLQEGIDSGVTSPQVLENIRFLVQTFPRFSAILTGSRRLKRLREEHWSALYGLGTRFGVSSLPAEHARRLVAEPVSGRLSYSGEAVERSIVLTSGQPYLLQCLCNRVFDMAAQLKARSITLDLVNQAGEALVQDNEHFASLWDYAGSDRRRFILTLCHKESKGPDPFRLGVIQERLLEHDIEISDETLIADLEYLRELELIDLKGEASGGHYALAIPIMGTWIEKQQDFAAIKRKAKIETEDEHE